MKPLAFCFIVMTTFFGCSHERPKSEPSRTSHVPPIPEFREEAAFEQLLRQTSFGPRNPNSAGHAACREYLAQHLQSSADSFAVQDFAVSGYDGEELQLSNMVASFHPGLQPRILLCAHWDTRPRADQDSNLARRKDPILGANDGASGVAVLLELASIMKETPPPIGVDIVLFDGEDYGREGDIDRYLLGSRHFAKNKPPDYIPRFGILLDMVGDRYLELPKEQFSVRYAPDIVELVWATAQNLGVDSFVDYPGHEVLDDHIPLNQAGIRTIDIIDFDYPDPTNRFWHTHQDVPENCSAQSLGAVGKVLTHIVYSQRP